MTKDERVTKFSRGTLMPPMERTTNFVGSNFAGLAPGLSNPWRPNLVPSLRVGL